MQNFSNLSFEQRPIVGLFSEPNLLAICLLENLLATSCRVKIFSSESPLWLGKTTYLRGNKNLQLFEKADGEDFDYSIFIFSQKEKEEEEKARMKYCLKISQDNFSKILFVFPYTKYELNEDQAPVSNVSGTIYVPEIFGPRMDLSGENFTAMVIGQIVKNQKVSVFSGEDFCFPGFAPDVAKEIVKSIFSFGAYGKRVAILPRPLSSRGFLDTAKDISGADLVSARAISYRTVSKVDSKIILHSDLTASLKATFDWFANQDLRSYIPLKVNVTQKPKNKNLYDLGIGILLFLLAPFLLETFNTVILLGAYKVFSSGRFFASSALFYISEKSLAPTVFVFNAYSKIPLVGIPYEKARGTLLIEKRASNLGQMLNANLKTAKDITQNVLGKKDYDLNAYARRLSLGLDEIYQESGFLEGDIKASGTISQKLWQKTGFSKERTKILELAGIARELPELLGVDSVRTYLVLFQNNMELRPTGGFIGSFALVTFRDGKLVKVDVRDVYSADGQLKGHVEPPDPIRKYLGEAGWHIRDANWDADFGTSASKIEWFLGKEIDVSVDGVLGVDLGFVQRLLRETGAVTLPDFNLKVDSTNLYDKTQAQSEERTFPGSYQKASFLTALGKAVVERATMLDQKSYIEVSRAIASSLDEKHIQIFLHNKSAQRYVSLLAWDGSVSEPACEEGATCDWFGIVEANVGVNKLNRYVKRNLNFSESIENGELKRVLTVSYQNLSQANFGGKYKGYLRMIAPLDSEFGDAGSGVPEVTDVSGRKEAGIPFSVDAGGSLSVIFTWQSPLATDFSKKTKYQLFVRKQPGSDSDPISIETSGGFKYNTNLSRDLTLTFPGKPD